MLKAASKGITLVVLALTACYLYLALSQLYALFYPPSAESSYLAHGKPNPYVYSPMWAWKNSEDRLVSLQIYLSTSSSNLTSSISKYTPLLWKVEALNIDEQRTTTLNVSISRTILERKSISLYAHIFLSKGPKINETFDTTRNLYFAIPLTKNLPLLDPNATLSLLDSASTPDVRPKHNASIKPHWTSLMKLHFVNDQTLYKADALPADIVHSGSFRVVYNPSTMKKEYYPILYVNDLALMRKDYVPLLPEEAKRLNDETTSLNELIKLKTTKSTDDEEVLVVPLEIQYSSIPLGWWRLCMHLQESLSTLAGFGFSETELDNMRQMLTQTDLYLLALTFVVSLLHILFDFLAFKNDIVFFSSRTSYVGLSSVSILLNTGCQFIVLLYLIDNDTPYIVVGPVLLGILIELWKLKRITRFSFKTSEGFSFSFGTPTAGESRTAAYDTQAFKFLSIPLLLIVLGYGVYSLVFLRHKGWYSWILETLTSAIYAIGFILMTPQLFINYKLKSVAHLPWRAFMYRALNTFIDDLFAFIIVMPTLHRISCFRDDIVFFVYLYQRWSYPVDKSRSEDEGDHVKQE